VDDIDLNTALKSALKWWGDVGVDIPPIAPTKAKRATPRKSAQKNNAPPMQKPTAAQKPTPPTNPSVAADCAPIAKAAKTLDALKTAIESFDAGALSDNARQAVFSRGNPNAEIMIIGEAPGRDEDIQGKPFVGRSGQLLDKIFASIGLTEEHVYITNVVNWRPPNNRTPNADEIAMCLPFLKRHIELKNPKIICIVGSIAMKALTDYTSITRSRGQWSELGVGESNIPALIIYHPAYLLRQPHLKRDVWRDMLALRAKIDASE